MTDQLLYIAAQLPTLSETFVYRELLGLRARGWRVAAASVHTPQRDLGDPALDALADDAVLIYGGGAARLLRDALLESMQRPLRSVRTFGLAVRDALLGSDVRGMRRIKVLWQGAAGLALARRARPIGVTHIHAHMAHVPTTIGMFAAAQLGVRFSFTGHANDIFQQRTLLAEKLRRAAFVACISRWHRAFYREFVDVPDERLPIVRCGVDVPPPRTSNPAAPTIVSVGRLIAKKGFDVLIRAMGRLAAEGETRQCTIVGGGPERAALEALVAREGAERIVALLGAQSHEKVKQIVAAADIFVLPCRVDAAGDRDGIPVALMEAMAAGLCVISGDLPAIRELVIHERTGLLVPPGDVEALVAALRRALHDAELRGTLADAGRTHVQAEFSDDVNLTRLAQALQRVGAGRA